MKGGYQIIDFTGIINFNGTETLPGAFEAAKVSVKTSKPIAIVNCLGKAFFSYDATSSDTTKAICPFIDYDNGTFTNVGIVINADDTIDTI